MSQKRNQTRWSFRGPDIETALKFMTESHRGQVPRHVGITITATAVHQVLCQELGVDTSSGPHTVYLFRKKTSFIA